MPGFKVTVEGKSYRVDAPDPNTAWDWANQYHAEAGAKREQAVKADQAATGERFKADEAARPWWEKTAINLGAGMDTAIEGGKLLLAKAGIGEGVSDEELRESRRVKEGAAEAAPYYGRLAQIAGEAAPAALIPMGA